MKLFDEYENHPNPFVRERANKWAVAIGLQRVNGLSVSNFHIQVTRQEIEGEITLDEALFMIDEHYTKMASNRSSYEIVPPDSEESKRIAAYNKAKRPKLYN